MTIIGPAGHSLMYDPMGNMIKTNSQELLKGLLKPYLAEIIYCDHDIPVGL
jgi:hypothetical protein